MSFGELDPVVLAVDIPECGRPKRSLGAIVHVYASDAFEVEFVTASGRTAALVTLKPSQIRKATDEDLICVSRLGGSASAQRGRSRAR